MYAHHAIHRVWTSLIVTFIGVFVASFAFAQDSTTGGEYQGLETSPNARGRAAGIVVATPPWKHSNLTHDVALKCEPATLARGYLELKYILEAAQIAKAGGTVYTWANGSREMVDRLNAETFIADLQERLRVYASAIETRGYQKLHQAYDLTLEGRTIPTLVDQTGFEFHWTAGASRNPGVVVEDAVAIENAINPEITLIGQITDQQIALHEEAVGISAQLQPPDGELQLRHSDGSGPEYAMAYFGRAIAYLQDGECVKAIADATSAIDCDANFGRGFSLRSQIRASCPHAEHRNSVLALQDAEKFCEISQSDREAQWVCRALLAAAHAESGDFDRAVSLATEAVELAPQERQDDMRETLAGYKAGKPYRLTIESH